MKLEIKKMIRPKFLLFIGLMLIVSFLAGIFGELFAKLYLSKLSFFSDLYFTGATNLGSKEIVIREPRKVVVEQDLILAQIQNEISPATVSIYRKKIAKNLLDKAYLPSDYLAPAVVLTNDGWLISQKNNQVSIRDSIIVTADKKEYQIEKIVEDAKTNIIFIKIFAQNLAVTKFADSQKITDSQQIAVYNKYYDQLNLANILDPKYKPITNKFSLVQSDQDLNNYILLNKNFKTELIGAPLYNFSSELIGFLATSDQVMPINYIAPIINQVLKGEDLKRPYLGINYLNLSEISGLSEEDSQGVINGVLLWPDESGLALKNDSPLLNKLVKGDIIISLEDQQLDKNNDLQDLLFEYKSGQEIRLKYLREKKEDELSVILK
jgi:S1-C subfamily serine protease